MDGQTAQTAKSRNPMMPGVDEIHIPWTSEGMSCDGDSVSVTAATLPSIEDIVLGAIPGLPKVHLHNKVLAYEVGDEFMAPFWAAVRGDLEPFILVVEGSIPNEQINGDGYWSAMGNNPDGTPKTLNEWLEGPTTRPASAPAWRASTTTSTRSSPWRRGFTATWRRYTAS